RARISILIPPGTVTYPCDNAAGSTAIDLIWGNTNTEESIITCNTTLKNDHGSDYLAIETILDLTLWDFSPAKPSYDYSKTNWDLLKTTLMMMNLVYCQVQLYSYTDTIYSTNFIDQR